MFKRCIFLLVISIMLIIPSLAWASGIEAPQDFSVYCDENGTFILRWVEPQTVTELTDEISGNDEYVLCEIDWKVNDGNWKYDKKWTFTENGIMDLEGEDAFHNYIDNIIHDKDNAIECFLVPHTLGIPAGESFDLVNNTYYFRVRYLHEYPVEENGTWGYRYNASPFSKVVSIGKGTTNQSDKQPKQPEPDIVTNDQPLSIPVSSSDNPFGKSTISSNNQLYGQIYYLPVDTEELPDFAKLNPVGTIFTNELNIPERNFEEGFPGVTDRFEWFGIAYTGKFGITQPGNYSFLLSSDDGSKLYIDGKLVINNDYIHPLQEEIGSVYLTPGNHDIRIEYFQGPAYEIALQLFITPPKGVQKIFSTKDYPSSGDNISVWMDNSKINFDSPPVVENGRTLVPFRQIFEALGAKVWYDGATNSAMGQKGDLIIQLPIGKSKAFVNGNEVTLDVGSKISNGRTIVPLRFISENLGCKVTAQGDLSDLIISIN